jgi:hypothetical protein
MMTIMAALPADSASPFWVEKEVIWLANGGTVSVQHADGIVLPGQPG